jgi:hypothetical protein
MLSIPNGGCMKLGRIEISKMTSGADLIHMPGEANQEVWL